MRRRLLLFGGAAAASGLGAPSIFARMSARDMPSAAARWTGSEFAAGGTKAIDLEALPAPLFRQRPNCIATLANIVGPCDAEGVPVRTDISENRPGLPMRVSIRVVDAANCRPHAGAEVQVWHTNARGIYSGAAVERMCTFGDRDATSGLAFRGRQMTDAEGVANFLTVYPGWYGGRCVHVHVRVIVSGREVLVSQLFFDDLLSDAVYAGHPDYAGRSARDTRNVEDDFVPRRGLRAHTFDFDKLDGGIMQASYTMGVMG